jgi:hypothetical protein
VGAPSPSSVPTGPRTLVAAQLNEARRSREYALQRVVDAERNLDLARDSLLRTSLAVESWQATLAALDVEPATDSATAVAEPTGSLLVLCREENCPRPHLFLRTAREAEFELVHEEEVPHVHT